MNEIDIVYTYVNSNDNEWKLKRENTKKLYYDPKINNIDSNISDRYDDNDELKISLRSIEKYFIECVRNIYIVTDNHIPEWLNISHEKIKIIDHKDIIPNEYLPTFNSHIIELFLHKIPNISSPFIYLNDDIIFMKPLSINNFISDTNKFFVCLNKNQYTKKGEPNIHEYGYRSAWKNSNKWLDHNFINEPRRKMEHSPMIIYPHIVDEILNKMDLKFHNQRFRSIYDYNILCSVYMYYSLYSNYAIENDNIKCESIFNGDNLTKLKDISEIDILCINSYSKDVFEYLLNKFIEKSSFEI